MELQEHLQLRMQKIQMTCHFSQQNTTAHTESRNEPRPPGGCATPHDIKTGESHHQEHQHGAARQHCVGQQLEQATDKRKQPQSHQHAAGDDADFAAGDAGEADHAVVLGKGDVGEAMEDGSQQTVHGIGNQSAADAAPVFRPLGR